MEVFRKRGVLVIQLKKIVILAVCSLSILLSAPTLFAKGKKKSSGDAPVEDGKRNLSSEGVVEKRGRSSVVDFDETSITGVRKNPMGTMIEQSKGDRGSDFIEVRKNWHMEMIQTANSLDTKSRSKSKP